MISRRDLLKVFGVGAASAVIGATTTPQLQEADPQEVEQPKAHNVYIELNTDAERIEIESLIKYLSAMYA